MQHDSIYGTHRNLFKDGRKKSINSPIENISNALVIVKEDMISSSYSCPDSHRANTAKPTTKGTRQSNTPSIHHPTENNNALCLKSRG